MGPLALDGTGSRSLDLVGVFFSSSLTSAVSFSNSSLVLSLFSSLSPASLACFSSNLLGSSLSILLRNRKQGDSIFLEYFEMTKASEVVTGLNGRPHDYYSLLYWNVGSF